MIVTYLSSHALLVYNEARQKEIISMYNEVAGNLPSAARQKYQLETTLPEECCKLLFFLFSFFLKLLCTIIATYLT